LSFLLVVDRSQEWPFEIPRSSVVTARAYLTDPVAGSAIDAEVINLSRASRYQRRGYYVSLLAEARGHRPLPDVKSIEDLQSEAHLKVVAAELNDLVRSTLKHDATELFELDAYFGGDPAALHPELAHQLFVLTKVPLVRAHFRRTDETWGLDKLVAIGLSDVPPRHRAFLLSAVTSFVSGDERPQAGGARTEAPRVAILVDPTEVDRPSNEEAIRRFVAIAPAVGLSAEIIAPDSIERISEFDGLFIRATTNVSHYTYEFARRAASLGLPVFDDPDSILKCTNKVYLNELMGRHKIPTPKTVIVHRENIDQVIPALGLPCILKQPDGGFGLGVVKIETPEQLIGRTNQFLESSELLIAQEWLPTEFDWRVCVFDGRPLFVCKYFMAQGHWQIIKRGPQSRVEGDTLTLSVGEAPEAVVSVAVHACNLIGNGLYGVDLKQAGEQCYLIEINDNPNVDAGHEDKVLGDALYREVMGVFARRIGDRRRAGTP
jgi:glutathione synthase/RimK-type ligase-like ATP-grasp enzyme